MKEEKQPINVTIVDGESFFAHELSVNFTPTQFTFDFKNITPRTDPRSRDAPSFTLKHNVVMMEPWHVKAMHEVLSNVMKKYEEEYEKITKPAAIVKGEKKQRSASKLKSSEGDVPSYLG